MAQEGKAQTRLLLGRGQEDRASLPQGEGREPRQSKGRVSSDVRDLRERTNATADARADARPNASADARADAGADAGADDPIADDADANDPAANDPAANDPAADAQLADDPVADDPIDDAIFARRQMAFSDGMHHALGMLGKQRTAALHRSARERLR